MIRTKSNSLGRKVRSSRISLKTDVRSNGGYDSSGRSDRRTGMIVSWCSAHFAWQALIGRSSAFPGFSGPRCHSALGMIVAGRCHHSCNTARTPSSTARRSSRDKLPSTRRNRDRSTARIWSHIATASWPAEDTATITGGRGVGPVESGTTLTVRRTRLTASAPKTTAGRVFWISAPHVGSKAIHQTEPRRILVSGDTRGGRKVHACG